VSAELRRRIAFTLGALVVYRLGTYIPLPGINPAVLTKIFNPNSGGNLGMFNMFAGGGIHRMAIFAVGIAPYLTAAVVVQLGRLVYRKAAASQTRDLRQAKAVARLTLGLAILFTAFQGLGVAFALERGVGDLVSAPGWAFRISTALTLTGGTVFLIWLCKLVTLHGVGNGISLIILAGIVAELPSAIAATLELRRLGALSTGLIMVVVVVMVIAVIAFIVFMELARRRLPIEYPARQVGDRAVGPRSADLSLKLNSAGIIPFVMATWLLNPLVLILDFAGGLNEASVDTVTWLFGFGQPGSMIFTAVAVVFFVFVYAAFVLDPEDTAAKLKRFGGTIAGVAPGEATAAHVDYVVSRTTVLGAAYLAAVYLIPVGEFVAFARVPFYFGGITTLVAVCVTLDVVAQVRGDGLVNAGGYRQ
jgi:preprotein translocase subunit SecY